jgi:hypothetical protein
MIDSALQDIVLLVAQFPNLAGSGRLATPSGTILLMSRLTHLSQ